MTARILDGKQIAASIEAELTQRVTDLIANKGITPKLVAVLVGDNPASQVYVRNKEKACKRIGMASELCQLPSDTTEAALLTLIDQLNTRNDVHGILVQLPLPKHIREQRVLDAVTPLKDVDCFHPENVGRMLQGRPRFLPCTPHGCQQILFRSGINVAGAHVVVVGRSEIVGKPVAAMLAAKDSHLGPTACNATVTLAHSRTHDLSAITRLADILVAAIGVPQFIKADMIKPGAVVIDVGINRIESGLVGDVDYQPALEIASAITPVPGGVGPLTIAMLMENTLKAAELS